MKAAELFDLKGRVALVTGASGGLGLRFAEVLAANGASVALVARRADKLKAAVAKIEKAGGKAIAVEADVLDRAAMNRAFDQAEKALGTVTILVNNAGVAHSTRAIDVTEDEWNHVVRTNLDAVFFWAQEGARRMLAANKKGAIVNIASVLGFGVSKGTIAYATAKAGVIQMTKALGNELAFKGVRVNAIAPGWFVTDINRDYLSSEAGQEAHPRHSGRPLRPGRRSRRRAAAAGVGRRRLHRRRDHRVRRRPDGRAARRIGGISWTSRSRPRSKTFACAPAPSSRSMCCRSNPIRRISPSTRTSRTSGSTRCARRPRRPASGRRSRRRNTAAWTCRWSPGR